VELKADEDYGGAAQPRPGGCYRLVYDDQGKLTGCPGMVNASWWLRVGAHRFRVDSWASGAPATAGLLKLTRLSS
jgi:hypothetical protein